MADGDQGRARLVDAGLTTLLLLQGITLFVVIPLGAAVPQGRILLDLCHLAFASVCIGVLVRHRGAQAALLATLALLVAGPWAAGALGRDLAPSPVVQHEVIAAAAFAFNGGVTIVVAAHVFAATGRVTVHRVRGAVLLYLNVAALFAIAYGWIAMNVPGAFGGLGASTEPGRASDIATFSYFSLSTITTTGYGDMVALHPLARSVANLEAVFGALFPATLLSRLVTLHLRNEEERT